MQPKYVSLFLRRTQVRNQKLWCPNSFSFYFPIRKQLILRRVSWLWFKPICSFLVNLSLHCKCPRNHKIMSTFGFYVCFPWIYSDSSSAFEEEARGPMSLMCFGVDGCFVCLNKCNAAALKAWSCCSCWHTSLWPASVCRFTWSVRFNGQCCITDRQGSRERSVVSVSSKTWWAELKKTII